MPAAGRLTRRLLAAVLLLQAALAPALCLASAAKAAASVEICTADGLRTVHLGQDDPGQGGAGHDGHAGGVCLGCHALPQAAAPAAVPVLPAPAWVVARAPRAATAPAASLPPAIRGPPAGPRAPPSLVS